MFRIINHSSFFFQMSTKRKNRGKVQSSEFVLISDQQETHQRTKHAGQKVKFQIFPGDSKQRKVSAMFSAPPIHCAHPWRRIQDYRLHHRGQIVKNCIRYFRARKGFIIGAHAQKKSVTSLYDIKRGGVSNIFWISHLECTTLRRTTETARR